MNITKYQFKFKFKTANQANDYTTPVILEIKDFRNRTLSFINSYEDYSTYITHRFMIFSVHSLRPENINVVAALGDSITVS